MDYPAVQTASPWTLTLVSQGRLPDSCSQEAADGQNLPISFLGSPRQAIITEHKQHSDNRHTTHLNNTGGKAAATLEGSRLGGTRY